VLEQVLLGSVVSSESAAYDIVQGCHEEYLTALGRAQAEASTVPALRAAFAQRRSLLRSQDDAWIRRVGRRIVDLEELPDYIREDVENRKRARKI